MKTDFRAVWKALFIVFFIYSILVTFCFFYLLFSPSHFSSSDLSASYDSGYEVGYNSGYSFGYSEGNEHGKISGKNAGYNQGYQDGLSNNEFNSLSPILLLPGTILHAPKYACTCPFTVETSPDNNIYYIYLERTLSLPPLTEAQSSIDRTEITTSGYYSSNLSSDIEGDDISFSSLGGHSETINVPPGSYRLWYSCGPKWYGLEDYFGPDTVWFTSDDILTFYETPTDYVGNTITLYNVMNGNFDTYSVPASDVPFLN